MATKGNLRECKNSRGITLLSAVEKILGSIYYRSNTERSRQTINKEQAIGKAGEQETRSSSCIIS